ncbi:hypothetical protein JW948_17725 [bacterium]|nr:hypothetical protein [bacterium]
MKKIIAILLSAGLFFLFCDKKNTSGPETVTIEDLLVKDNEISGWSRSGDFWLASSSTELAVYIDGAADLYTRHGFVEAVSQTYQGLIEDNTESITIRIYDQANKDNAVALFPDYINENTINPETWSEVGEDARIERFVLGSQIVFHKSSYFVYMEVSSSLEQALDILKSFARNVDRKIK